MNDGHRLFEEAGEHDAADREDEAIPLYELALSAGLEKEKLRGIRCERGTVGSEEAGRARGARAKTEFTTSRSSRSRCTMPAAITSALAELIDAIVDEGDYEKSSGYTRERLSAKRAPKTSR